MTDLPSIVRKKLVQPPPPDHPDPDLLTAFAERSLGSGESGRVLQHLAFCSSCRDVLALAAPEAVLAPAAGPGKAHASIFRWPVLRWAGAAAAVCVVVAAVVTQSDKLTREASAPQSAAVSSQMPAVAEQQELSDNMVAKVQRPSESRSNEAEQRKKTEQGSVGKAAAPSVPVKQAEPVVPRNMLDARAETQPSAAVTGRQMSALVTFEGRPVAPPAAGAAVGIYSGSSVNGRVAAAVPQHEGGMMAKRAQSVAVTSEAAAVNQADESVSFTKAKDSPVMAGVLPEFRWSLSATGELQRSPDGQAWTPVTISQGSVFRALYFSGAEVWAGGNGGALFHSTDSGTQWTRVTIGGDFAGDIVGIEFTNPQRGRIRTSTGQLWETRDGGQSWQRL